MGMLGPKEKAFHRTLSTVAKAMLDLSENQDGEHTKEFKLSDLLQNMGNTIIEGPDPTEAGYGITRNELEGLLSRLEGSGEVACTMHHDKHIIVKDRDALKRIEDHHMCMSCVAGF